MVQDKKNRNIDNESIMAYTVDEYRINIHYGALFPLHIYSHGDYFPTLPYYGRFV